MTYDHSTAQPGDVLAWVDPLDPTDWHVWVNCPDHVSDTMPWRHVYSVELTGEWNATDEVHPDAVHVSRGGLPVTTRAGDR